MSPGLDKLAVDVQANVIPVLVWGDDEFPIHDLLRDRYIATDATNMLRDILHDLDKMQRTEADATDADDTVRILKAQRADHAAHARTIRTYLQGLKR